MFLQTASRSLARGRIPPTRALRGSGTVAHHAGSTLPGGAATTGRVAVVFPIVIIPMNSPSQRAHWSRPCDRGGARRGNDIRVLAGSSGCWTSGENEKKRAIGCTVP